MISYHLKTGCRAHLGALESESVTLMCVATRLHALRSAFVNDPQTAICMPPGFIAKLACEASIGSLQNTHNIHLARQLNYKTDRPS